MTDGCEPRDGSWAGIKSAWSCARLVFKEAPSYCFARLEAAWGLSAAESASFEAGPRQNRASFFRELLVAAFPWLFVNGAAFLNFWQFRRPCLESQRWKKQCTGEKREDGPRKEFLSARESRRLTRRGFRNPNQSAALERRESQPIGHCRRPQELMKEVKGKG